RRHGLAVGGRLTSAGASAERDTAIVLAAGAIPRARATLAADKAYDTRLRGHAARARRHAASGAEHDAPSQRNRRPDHPTPRLRAEPASAQAGRGDLRLAEDGGTPPPDTPPRTGSGRLEVRLRPGHVQLAADSKSHGGACVNGPHRDGLMSSSPRPHCHSLNGNPARRLSYCRFSIAC